MQATVASPQQVAALVNRLNHQVNRTAAPDMFRVLGELELSFTQVKALFHLQDQGELSVKEIASRLGMSVPAVSRAVDGLVQREFVTRRESESDRRSRQIALLPQGGDVLERVMAARQAALVEFASQLSDAERGALHEALLPIVERLASP